MHEIRLIKKEDIPQINILRKQVHEMHANQRPDIFASEFGEDLSHVPYETLEDDFEDVFVAVEQDASGEKIVGYIDVSYLEEKDTTYFQKRKYCYIEEIYVIEEARQQGIASEMIHFAQKRGKEKGCTNIYVDVWAFNKNGILSYEKIGFRPLRQYMELEGDI